MKILIIGSGGREHAILDCVRASPKVGKIFAAPGNAGMSSHAECVAIPPENIGMLKDFACKNAIDLTIVGPELPLTLGIVDEFTANGLKIFGPTRKASILEGSKIFAKEFARRHGIPTAPFRVFDELKEAKSWLKGRENFPVVIKADGLAAGKGVVIAKTRAEAEHAFTDMMLYERFGTAGRKVLAEDFLPGEEASFIVVTDGRDFVAFPPAQDHKRAFDNDEGPNTGGMGAYAPAPIITDAVREKILTRVIKPTLAGMMAEDKPYRGFLYAGVMIHAGEPYLIEFNCRLGDPETEVVLPLLKSDFIELMESAMADRIGEAKVEFDPGFCTTVVMASQGYPGDYRKGLPISGIPATLPPDTAIFHAGTRRRGKNIVTDGGRVLAVSGKGATLEASVQRAYETVAYIRWEGAYYRRDIAAKGLKSDR